jgi:EF-hand domain
MCNWVEVGLVVMVLVGGCSGAPQRVKPPKIDPSSAATQAMELYDTNHDAKLSQEELARCPGVLVAFDSYDTDNNKLIDAEEFQQHLSNLLRNGTGATQLVCNVSYQGQPLGDAKVVLEPEPYLGSDIQPAEGVTSSFGAAHVGMSPEKTPAALKAFKLIQYGTFKVRITHPKIQLPAKYNTDTTLGYETTPGDPAVSFALSAK